MNQCCVPNRLKATKKTNSGLTGSLNIKKNRNLIESSFFKNFSIFFCVLSHLETSQFSYRGSVNYKLSLQSNEAQ